MRIFIILFMLVTVYSCKESSKNKGSVMPPPPPPIIKRDISDLYFSKDTNSLFGIYATPHYNFGGTVLALFPDMRYEYVSGGCTSAWSDSGAYSVSKDSIIFTSSFTMADVKAPVQSSHSYKTRLNRALLVDKKIVFSKERDIQLYRRGMNHFEIGGLDKSGNGEAFRLDRKGHKVEEGVYKGFRLFSGERNVFTVEAEIRKER